MATRSHTAGSDHVAGVTFHARRGSVDNRFRYRVDYLLIDAEAPAAEIEAGCWPLRRNRPGLISLQDRDHGGVPGAGVGAAWARRILADHGLGAATEGRLSLLAQPRVLGHVFNPVSFWLAQDRSGALRAVIAEVSNTFGDRHSYLCHRDDMGPIGQDDHLTARKVFHVSPFQDVAGTYGFTFDIRSDRIAIRIELRHGDHGVIATLQGSRRRATTASLLGAALRRPFGSRRVLALIHWQALRLWWKGASFRPRPEPPASEISR